jgi:nucleoid-associated protein YgaU
MQTQANERIAMSHLGFTDLLVEGATWALGLAAVWAALIAAALLLEVATAGRVRATWACPSPWRRALLAGLGLVFSGGALGVPASAAPPRPAPLSGRVEGLPGPARPVGGVSAGPAVSATPVVVRPGDTLWGLATDALPRHARAPDVARLVLRVHHLNRAVIGPDPDHLEPGQRLLVPAPHREDRP